MAPATGYVHRALPLDHQGDPTLGKRDGPSSDTPSFAGYIAAIVILAAIIVGRSPFGHLAGPIAWPSLFIVRLTDMFYSLDL